MSVGISLLFIEKQVEAVRLCAALTEPFATGTVPGHEADLLRDYEKISKSLSTSFDELKKQSGEIERDTTLEEGDVRHAKQRVETVLAEVARAAQDFAAQIRFFQAMNPNHASAAGTHLKLFELIDRNARAMQGEQPEDEAELAPADDSGIAQHPDEADPTLM
jgi:septal ring factor EnvC (AmiA/AmiB activator)